MAFALPCRWDCASAAVDQQPEGSRNRGRLRMRLLRSWLSCRHEIGRVYKELVGLGIKSQVSGAEFCFDRLHYAETVRRILVVNVQRAFPCRDKKCTAGWLVDIRIYASPNRKGLHDLARINIHNSQHFVASTNEKPVMLGIKIDGRR